MKFTHRLYQYMFNFNILLPKRYSNDFTCVNWQGILIIDAKFHCHLSSFFVPKQTGIRESQGVNLKHALFYINLSMNIKLMIFFINAKSKKRITWLFPAMFWTLWSQLMQNCFGALGHHCSGNGLPLVWHKAITGNNAGSMSIWPLWTNLGKIWAFLQEYAFKNIACKIVTTLFRPYFAKAEQLFRAG